MGFGGLIAESNSTLTGRLRVAQECILYLLGLRKKYKIANQSMMPALQAGDFVLVNPKAFERNAPQTGDLVIAAHPQQHTIVMIKRVSKVEADQIDVVSDNPYVGQDSRHFGALSMSDMLGRVTAIVN